MAARDAAPVPADLSTGRDSQHQPQVTRRGEIMRKVLAALTVFFVAAAAAVTADSAAAAAPVEQSAIVSYPVCNSDFSSTTIEAFNPGSGQHRLIPPGTCEIGDNTNGSLRIDPDAGFGPDVSRYRIGGMFSCGSGYRAWVSGEAVFNPPDAWQSCGIRVHND